MLPRCRAGDDVSFPRNNVSKCGNIISVGFNHEKAVKYAHLAVSNITMRLEPFNERTDAFLSGKCEEDEKGFPPSAFTFAPGQKGSFSGPGEGTVIPENAKVLPLMPETLLPLADSVEDWNHTTLRQTLEKYDMICPVHPELDGKLFWSAVLRGGIQGALYVTDCIRLKGKK